MHFGVPDTKMETDRRFTTAFVVFLIICTAPSTSWKDWNKKYESPDYTVEKVVEGKYEQRKYPASIWACTNMTVDTAQDPLAGLENMDFRKIMMTKRYKTRVPSSLMFWPLFNYIGGNNYGKIKSSQKDIHYGKIKSGPKDIHFLFVGSVKIEMTMGVTTKHTVLKRDTVWGDLEKQEMCFYLEKKFQADGTEPVPEPLDPAVYIQKRPELNVYVKKFPG